ncbi:RluA family pseudouridine synthase [Leptotrichia sp. oral taxon 218]|nr:RluA family pseudouridine synthase [Leptotrichia sp. oral taxon 218]QUB96233.1 RluA family pseudouridine synthase [Leptotrichia sp. oral taxon 218]
MENMRLDRYLRKQFKNEPLNKIFSSIRNGDVKVNAKKSKENYRLSLGDILTIKMLKSSEKKENKFEKIKIKKEDIENYKKMVIFENKDFFIVNKKEKIAMHKGTGHSYGLSEVFKKIYQNENINFSNRLDYDTSGLVIGCKNLKFLRYISEKIRNNEVKKKYFAIVHNNNNNNNNNINIKELKELKKENKLNFKIENYLTTEKNGVIVSDSPISKDSKKSITYFKEKKLAHLKNFELLKDKKNIVLDVDLVTGRKHQIRAQLANAGLPIIGDSKYGKKEEKFYLCCYFVSFDNYEFSIESEVFI